MKNIPLLIFDFILLPVSLVRWIMIYFYGSRYGIQLLQPFDVMNHATNQYFNQGQHVITIDTVPDDVRFCVNNSSRITAELLGEFKIPVQNPIVELPVSSQSDAENIFINKSTKLATLKVPKNTTDNQIAMLQKLLPKILSTIGEHTDIEKINHELDIMIRQDIGLSSIDSISDSDSN